MNYKEEFERELNETKKGLNVFYKMKKVQKNAFADYIKEAYTNNFIEEQKQLEEKEKQENKVR